MALYLDTSALVKLVIREPESTELRRYVADREVVSSLLVRAELIRAVARHEPASVEAAEGMLSGLRLTALSEVLVGRAAWLGPWELRALDALHLASAMALHGALEALVTYDQRMIQAGQAAGLPVTSPGDAAA
ncbi:MAG: type II toxin-antitoxin system VapC family toxin [Mycobacteriales bacterium]